MAKRNVLHKNLFEDFQKWLVANGWEIEKPKGTYEVLRARKDGRPQPLIVYMKADAKEHLTVMDRDFEIVRAFLRDKKKTQTNADRIRSMTDDELAQTLFDSCIEVMQIDECPYIDNVGMCKKCILDWLQREREE